MPTLRVALAGNPNVGKSTLFNRLTGLHQHTGNWCGKTVACAEGLAHRTRDGVDYTLCLTDLPGIYSLSRRSAEEEAAQDFLRDTPPDVVVTVCDGVALERNLRLAQSIAALCPNMILCVNCMDEAARRGLTLDTATLASATGWRVVETDARRGVGVDALADAILDAYLTPIVPRTPCPGCTGCGCCAFDPHSLAASVLCTSGDPTARDRAIDRILVGKYTAIPLLAVFTALLFWLTLTGSGYLSAALESVLALLLRGLRVIAAPLPPWLASLLCDGIADTVCRVTAVMLPPMAIFFPLFTYLEDLGYLPRVAFLLDRLFAACGSSGKQALTMLQSLGCHAAAVTGCRIHESPRTRAVAMLTTSFIPCNGRFPLLIAALAALGFSGIAGSLALLALFLLAVAVTLIVTAILCRGRDATPLLLELPPYRVPRLGPVLVRSLLDRTVFVLGRALCAAAPAGVLIWLLARIPMGETTLDLFLTTLLDPIAAVAGLNGAILLAFLLALPAAELMLPLAIAWVGLPLTAWNSTTLVCTMLFMLFHFPCATTLATIRRESGSRTLPIFAALLPTAVGYGLCVLVNILWHLF